MKVIAVMKLKISLPTLTHKLFPAVFAFSFSVLAGQVYADGMSDAFNSASSLSGQSKNQGSNTLNQSNVTNALPSATSSPPQAGYYGGVQGNSNALDSAKQSVPANNDAYKAISDADTKNPPVKIDSGADFITNGANIEANSTSTFDGGNSYCSTNVVSKSVFQNYSCDRDLAVEQTCARNATIKVTGSKETYTKSFVLDLRNSSPKELSGNKLQYDFTVPDDGSITSGTWVERYPADPSWSLNITEYITVLQTKTTVAVNKSGKVNLPGNTVKKGQVISVVYWEENPYGGQWDNQNKTYIKGAFASGAYTLRLTLNMTAVRDSTKSELVWSESCGFNKSAAKTKTGSVCTQPGGTRSITQGGKTYSQTSSCWQYSDSYIVPVTSSGNCTKLAGDKNCTVTAKGCTETQNGTCMHEQDTYQCQVTYQSQGLVCGGNYFCQSGDCANTQPDGANEFGQLVAELAAVAAAGDDTKKTRPDISIFTGKPVSCRKAMAGFSNCCVDKGWGADAQLAHCNSEEKAIGEAKQKKVIIKVGTYCGTKQLGVCVQKKDAYCQFEGKLAKIIQEQGRKNQLHISFGNAEKPDCRGLTVNELQSVNFDIIDYADFYSEVQGNAKLPKNQETLDRIKAKINTQVGNMNGGH